MISRVIGKVDGAEVKLYHVYGDRWEVPVPLDQDGEYAVEILAEDEAGNQTYLAKMLYCVESSGLCVHIIPCRYYGCVMPGNYQAILAREQYQCTVIEPMCSICGR